MRKVYSIGEALIDFIPIPDENKQATLFEQNPGGAPANVAATIARLGGNATFIGSVGKDMFGIFLKNTLKHMGVNTEYLFLNAKANTALAFVSITDIGERSFSFYRNPSADMLLNEQDIEHINVEKQSILHFCSVDLIEAPVKYATKKFIHLVKEKEGLISFDPNLRFNLWDDLSDLKKTVHEFITYTDLLKVSDDEIEFITGEKDLDKGIEALLNYSIKILIVTEGKKGATIYINNSEINTFHVPGYSITVKDTTGSGDAFIGAFLYRISTDGYTEDKKIIEYIKFANAVAAIVTSKKGAMSSLPSIREVELFMNV